MEQIVYVFEGFRLDAGRRQLYSSGGVVIPLKSRAMEALLLLVARAGELVTKRQLLEGVWPSAVVEDNNINQCILAIRKALGESAGSNRFIMTVPGRGYRFVAPVMLQPREAVEEFAQTPPPAAPPPAVPRPTVPSPAPSRPGLRLAIAVALISGAGAVLMFVRPPRPDAVPAPAQLSVELHDGSDRAAAVEAQLLRECLRQRPDLHLQVLVQLVGAGPAHALWTRQYIAGVEDLVPGNASVAVDGNACGRLAVRQQNARGPGHSRDRGQLRDRGGNGRDSGVF